MNKKSVLLVAMLLLLTLFVLGKGNLFAPKIEAPVFVKSLIYSDDMDIDLNYIAPMGFKKNVEKIQVENAPKGIDCVVYGEEKELEGKYTVGTVNIGVNCAYWSEETGIGSDLEINKLLITWSDGSKTTEDIGNITVMARNKQCNNYMNASKQDNIREATYTLTKDTEITGLNFPYQDEMFDMISNITINDVPLEDISKDSPIKLKKKEICIIKYQVNDESKFKYGNVYVTGFLMGNSDKNEEKIAIFVFDKRFGFNESAGNYLKSNL
ncbi:MAG: hypothetical protein AB9836_10200 [Aminipila sp.]